jgi:hypothetical protein
VPAERCEVLKKERGDAEARARMPARPSRRFGWQYIHILAAAIGRRGRPHAVDEEERASS